MGPGILKQEDFSRELKLMLHLLNNGNEMRSNMVTEEYYHDIDWEHFLDLVIHHRVYPSIYFSAKKIQSSIIPSFVMKTLQTWYQKNTFKMLHLSAEMEKICRIFTEQDIRILVLKGPVLASELYGDISLRTSCDLDLLVSLKDLERAEDLVERLGFIKEDYIDTTLNDWKWRHHHFSFHHPDRGIKIEMHWRLNPGPSSEPGFEKLWDRRRRCLLTDYPIYQLGLEDMFLFLVTHGARHGWSRLRWLLDVHYAALKDIDWPALIALLGKHHMASLGGQALLLSSELLDTPIAAPCIGMVRTKKSRRLAQSALFYVKRMINLHTPPLPDEVAKYHKRYLFMAMSLHQKLIFILSFFYPYPEDTEALPLPKPLYFLYFPLRPAIWMYRKRRKHALL